jgi:primosomal protein N' (replication factor Y)
VLKRFERHELDILLGTQMITKGLHFPRVALVGILNTDMALDMPDFRARERTAQQVLQVAGRAGRGDLPGAVYVQTVQPEQPVFRFLERGDFTSFAAAELSSRKEHHYPPFTRLISIMTLAREESVAEAAMRMFVDRLPAARRGLFQAVGPAPAPMKRLRNQYRWQLILKTSRIRETLRRVDASMEGMNAGAARFNVNVDPMQLL